MSCCWFFFFNDTATTEIYTLALHDALPISIVESRAAVSRWSAGCGWGRVADGKRQGHAGLKSGGNLVNVRGTPGRSEEHTSELQSRQYLVCRILLEKNSNRKRFRSCRCYHV